MSARGPKDLSSEIERLARKLGKRSGGDGLLQARISETWSQVAGKTVTSHTTGARLAKGELVVLVDSPVWATELSALAGPYRQAMNESLGKELVRSVRFNVSRRVETEQRESQRQREEDSFYTQDDVPSVPLTDVERAQVRESVEQIEDPELREAVLRATIADMEWKKGIKAAKRPQAPRGGL